MVVVILTGHTAVRGHLYTVGLFDGDPTCRFCRKKTETVRHIICRKETETVQHIICRKETETVLHIICCCEVLARQRYFVFGNPLVEPKNISTASVRDLCLVIRGTGLLNLY
jgi:hypothetical protein